MRQFTYTYKVTGRGQFPIDMLRYDRSMPMSEIDSGEIIKTFIPKERRKKGTPIPQAPIIELFGLNDPLQERWRSFLWTIVPDSIVKQFGAR